ncbi:MAG: UDP-N-acetylmuramoyl-tripeptide--D-alanyl-D-alanine ligase [Clostridia bacterium]|nr:UDP-N-acetylmuramoyl-tripeptide--D-alanyl-D-alanine ligase [Clostridia bacterium]
MKITLAYPLTASTLASMVGGRLMTVGNTDPTVTYICTDSREADENTLFCAIRGERVDGHDFMAKAASLGCALFLCERLPDEMASLGCAAIQVADTVEALSALARAYRTESMKSLSVVAITGSVGKTTTKEMTAAVLAQGKTLFKKDGNFNSTIGLPLSFMEISAEIDCAVLEMGMSSRGEIASMTRAVRPNIAVIANIGSSHLEYLGSRENIARAKREIAGGLSEGGILLVNGDEPLLKELGQDFGEDLPEIPAGIRTLRVSLAGAKDADYLAGSIRHHDGGMIFDLTTPEGVWEGLYIPAVGEHLVWAASFAAAVGQLSGLTEGQVREGLAVYCPADMRQNIRSVGGVTVIEDCYNAAPESMRASLSVLAAVAAQAPHARRIAVLGDMKELGADTVALHRLVGKAVFDEGVDLLVTVGELGAEIACGAMEAGMSSDAIRIMGGADTYVTTAAYLKSILREGDHVLFKASRSMALETVAEAIFA